MATAFAEAPKPLTAIRSTKSKAERNQLVRDIMSALDHLGVTFEIDDQPKDVDLIIHGDRLHADVWVGIDETPTDVPIISWYRASERLAVVEGAWREEDINNVHRRKATSHPESFEHLILALQAGFAASRDGRAFIPHVVGVAS